MTNDQIYGKGVRDDRQMTSIIAYDKKRRTCERGRDSRWASGVTALSTSSKLPVSAAAWAATATWLEPWGSGVCVIGGRRDRQAAAARRPQRYLQSVAWWQQHGAAIEGTLWLPEGPGPTQRPRRSSPRRKTGTKRSKKTSGYPTPCTTFGGLGYLLNSGYPTSKQFVIWISSINLLWFHDK